MGRFARVLRRLRAAAGFPTAYAFYHRNGGKRAFPFSYGYYSQLERGTSVPRGEWLPLLLALLRLPPEPGARRELLEAYLRDLVGQDEVFDDLFAPLQGTTAAAPAAAKAVARLVGRQSRHVTPDEMDVILRTPASYWCFVALSAGRHPVSLTDLTARVGLPAAQIRAALAALARAKLAVRAGAERWSSPLADAFVILPCNYRGHARDRGKLKSYWDAMVEARGANLFDFGAVARIPTPAALEACAAFQRIVESAMAQYVDEDAPEAPTFILQARVRRALPA